MKWDHPSPEVWVATTTRSTHVRLEVFSAGDGDTDGEYAWWALSEGRIIGRGTAASLEEAQRDCEAVAA